MDCSPQGSSVHGISWQEYWSGLPFPPAGDLLNTGIEPASPVSPALQVGTLLLSHQRSPRYGYMGLNKDLQYLSIARELLLEMMGSGD